MGAIPGSGRSLAEGIGNPLQFSCLGNPMDRGARQATVHGVAKESDTTEYTRGGLEDIEKGIRKGVCQLLVCFQARGLRALVFSILYI